MLLPHVVKECCKRSRQYAYLDELFNRLYRLDIIQKGGRRAPPVTPRPVENVCCVIYTQRLA